MKKPNWSFVLAVLFGALFLLAFQVTTGLEAFPFDRQPTLQLLQTGSQYAADVAALGFFVAAGALAVRSALEPGAWWRKALGVLPTFCLGLFVAGIAFQWVGIGTLPVGGFATTWLNVSALLAVAATVIASALVALDRASLRLATGALGVMGGFSVLAWLAMIASVVPFLLNPAAGGGGGPGGPGGPEGSTQPLLIAEGLLTVFGVVALVTIVRAWRYSRQPAADAGAAVSPAAQVNLRGEAGRAVASLAAVTVVGFVAIQFVPVSKTNVPVQTPVTWDSPQSEALFRGACADCHSNETVRPWYDYIAPSSWLLASHISGAHAKWNISELNKLSPNDKKSLPNRISDALQNNIMPPGDYQFLHPAARLSDAQKQQLIAALKAVISK